MKYTVIWRIVAKNELAEIWLASMNRNAITYA